MLTARWLKLDSEDKWLWLASKGRYVENSSIYLAFVKAWYLRLYRLTIFLLMPDGDMTLLTA